MTMASLFAVRKRAEAETMPGWERRASRSYSRFVSSRPCFNRFTNFTATSRPVRISYGGWIC